MPHYIAVYDVSTDRVAKALKLFREYLHWVQNSVFEGELTRAQFAELDARARDLVQDEDSVVVYEMRTMAYTERRVIGVERGETGPFL